MPYGSGHEGVAGFAISWKQNQVKRELHLNDLTHMVLEILVNTGSGNGLLFDKTKLLSKLVLAYHQQDPLAFIPG